MNTLIKHRLGKVLIATCCLTFFVALNPITSHAQKTKTPQSKPTERKVYITTRAEFIYLFGVNLGLKEHITKRKALGADLTVRFWGHEPIVMVTPYFKYAFLGSVGKGLYVHTKLNIFGEFFNRAYLDDSVNFIPSVGIGGAFPFPGLPRLEVSFDAGVGGYLMMGTRFHRKYFDESVEIAPVIVPELSLGIAYRF